VGAGVAGVVVALVGTAVAEAGAADEAGRRGDREEGADRARTFADRRPTRR